MPSTQIFVIFDLEPGLLLKHFGYETEKSLCARLSRTAVAFRVFAFGVVEKLVHHKHHAFYYEAEQLNPDWARAGHKVILFRRVSAQSLNGLVLWTHMHVVRALVLSLS